mgnify:CR=1 FL=1
MSKRTRFVAAACALVGLVPSHAALAQQRDFPVAATATSEDRYPARVLAWPFLTPGFRAWYCAAPLAGGLARWAMRVRRRIVMGPPPAE